MTTTTKIVYTPSLMSKKNRIFFGVPVYDTIASAVK